MVQSTPKYSWPVPELDDPPDGPGQLRDLGVAIEGTLEQSQIVTWVPTWTSSGSPKPANPASLTGRYSLSQGWCDFGFTLTLGSSSTGGIGGWQFILPVAANSALSEQVFYGFLFEPQVARFPLSGVVAGGSRTMRPFAPRGGDMRFAELRQSDGGANSYIPGNAPGPVQSGGRVTFTGRYLTA